MVAMLDFMAHNFITRVQNATFMALRSRRITELNNLFFRSMKDISSDDNLSNEDVNHSLSLMLAQYD